MMISQQKRGHTVRALAWAAGVTFPLATALWSEAAAPPRAPVGNRSAAARRGAGSKSAIRNPQSAIPRSAISYNRLIRPILAENCFACHGPDSAARKAGLRLDRFADATADRSGHAALVPGKPAASEVLKRVLGQGPVMPPAATKKHLSPAQIALLKQWIAQGAQYEAHWSLIPPKRPALPAVKNVKWVRNRIDRFVLAGLEAKGLTPAPEADRRTLARRLSLDITGLPPDSAEVEAFVRDKSPNAYEKLIDRWMATPQWGEHRGRYWLDYARYADTHGIHFDNYREMWSYRDWVIGALNRNMPFDQFTIEQLAGDLLPDPTLEQKIASGFNRCNITTNEGGAIDEEYRVLYARDRTETVGQVWLGSTVGCAVCHDHKFDPLSQKEFYQLSAFFNNTTQAAMDGNIKDTPPVLPVPQPEDRERFAAIKGELEVARRAVAERKQSASAEFDKWLASADARQVEGRIPSEGLRFRAPLAEGKGREIQAEVEGQIVRLTAAAEPGWSGGAVAPAAFQRKGPGAIEVPNAGDFEKSQAFTCAAWVKLARGDQGGAIVARMDDQHDFRGWDLWVENGRVGTHIINKWPDDALKVVTRMPVKAGEWHHVCFTYSGGGNAAAVKVFVDGVPQTTDTQADKLQNTIRTEVPFKIGQRHTTAVLEGAGIQDVRLYGRALKSDEVEQLGRTARAAWLVSRGAAALSAPEKEELFGWWLTGADEPYRAANAKVAALQSEEQAILARGTIAHVFQERAEPAMAFVLARGEYDKRKDQVQPATPAALPSMPPDFPRNRLGFAKWLLLPNHPLTARTTVNRFWQELFGAGIVRTAGDFGIAGELPSNQALLDWMAVEFREGGWDVKKFVKLLLTSATYRQSAAVTPEKLEKDPQNRLLSRGPRFRMDAEMVRDYALAASGELVKKIGGPSVRPYQPDGVWEAVAMIGSNTRDYKRDSGESLYRRSMYTFWKRSAPPASMDTFNAPAREVCTVKRERTNTPLQALVTLNDVQFVEAARVLAQRALKEGGATDDSRIDFLARRLLARSFRATELPVVRKCLADLSAFYKSHAKEAGELIATGESKPDTTLPAEQLAAWTMLTNQLMNLDEVLNK
jgi:mono/diheme cytochrome c family protein